MFVDRQRIDLLNRLIDTRVTSPHTCN
ncbi:biofilm formation regulator BssR [Shigella flexneri]